MSLQVSSQSLANLTVGQSITPISWASLAPVFSGAQTLGAGYLRLFNESGCGIALQFNGGGGAKFLPAGAWFTFTLHDDDTGLTGSVSYVLGNAGVNQLVATYYLPGEVLDDTGPLGNSPVNVGGSVTTTNTTQLFPTNDTSHFLTLSWNSVVSELFIEPNVNGQLLNNPVGWRFEYNDHSGNTMDGLAIDATNGGAVRIFGAISSLNGIATATNTPGVPVQVAATIRQHITATTLTTVLTYTPSVTGVFRLSGYLFVNNGTSPNVLTFRVNFYDPDQGGAANENLWTINGSVSQAFNGTTSFGNGRYTLVSYTFPAAANQPITVSYQDPTNTPSDFVTVMLEQLA
ncbi:MAG TPA: hypothetical protein VKQ30_03235 [Ktedonobacterales bacterium]|nr:hypothetical protein [Ktedonobacterales bacterium]